MFYFKKRGEGIPTLRRRGVAKASPHEINPVLPSLFPFCNFPSFAKQL